MTPKPRLSAALLVSALVHGSVAAVLLWRRSQETRVVAVDVASFPGSATVAARAERKTAPLPAPVAPAAAPGVTTTNAATDADEASFAAVRAAREQYYAVILAAVERQKVYPALARSQGIEGRVGVSFRVAADGTVSDVAVKESSHSMLLDRAAVGLVGSLSPLPAPPPAIAGEVLTIPLIYSLR